VTNILAVLFLISRGLLSDKVSSTLVGSVSEARKQEGCNNINIMEEGSSAKNKSIEKDGGAGMASSCSDKIPAAGDAKQQEGSPAKSDNINQEQQALDIHGNPLSKKGLKRKLKFERAKDYRRQRKEQKKAKRRAEAIAAGRDLEEEQRFLEERTKEGGKAKERRQEEWRQRTQGLKSRFGICIDCPYEKKMTQKEYNSLAQQIRYSYAQNKRSPNPCQIYASHLTGETRALLAREAGFPDNWNSRAFECSEVSVVEMMQQHGKSKEQLVYLTSDSTNELKQLNDDHVYIIGGIVDRNRLKREAISYAEQLDIPTARLPIDEYIKLSATKVLTCNHVLEILLKYRERGNDWKQAMLDVLPQRKDVKENEAAKMQSAEAEADQPLEQSKSAE
jgi:tRNA (guanine9-N1)-methyltransferase